ncbi:piggyBac transposable element-derived protein 4-like [Diorhabda sublineata]|uniref:piggyBac transposable element-derived protein 4-like n=1 Tax=Diorhabda sublineata TaxID=1163346 RepID=UPI0024E0A217|nr:piggyBac transposable element-derived protein 4-like [Diorhabda sublineata]
MNRRLNENHIAQIINDFSDSESEGIGDTTQENILEEVGDISDCESIHSEHNSASEIEESDESSAAESAEDTTSNSFYGKNRFKWSKTPPHSSRIRQHNIIEERAGLKGPALSKNEISPIETWELLLADDIIQLIVQYTNQKLEAKYISPLIRPYYAKNIDSCELRTYFGLILLTAIFKSNHEDVRSLWASDYTGRDIFRGVMGLNRFLFIHFNITFDDLSTREQRKSTDKLALISEMFDKFIQNCSNNYTCSEYLCIDEMLVKFRGRCSFRMFIKSKPGKYGLKVQCMCDAKTHYLYNAFIYTGKPLIQRNSSQSVPTQDVLKLTEPVYGSNRNITGDSWFTSIELVDLLLQKGLTYVGTIRKNKREIPREFLPNKTRPEESSLFGFVRDKTLVSHVPKKNKSVVLLSSMHHEISVNEQSKKPEIIEFYNSTKGGVDALDLKCSNYSCSRRTRRWTNAIFGAIMNVSIANGYVLWVLSNQNKEKSRRKYIKSIAMSLIKPHICQRLENNTNLTKDVRAIMIKLMDKKQTLPSSDEPGPSAPKIKRRCYSCPRSKDKKSTIVCKSCKKTICKPHSVGITYCLPCLPKE